MGISNFIKLVLTLLLIYIFSRIIFDNMAIIAVILIGLIFYLIPYFAEQIMKG